MHASFFRIQRPRNSRPRHSGITVGTSGAEAIPGRVQQTTPVVPELTASEGGRSPAVQPKSNNEQAPSNRQRPPGRLEGSVLMFQRCAGDEAGAPACQVCGGRPPPGQVCSKPAFENNGKHDPARAGTGQVDLDARLALTIHRDAIRDHRLASSVPTSVECKRCAAKMIQTIATSVHWELARETSIARPLFFASASRQVRPPEVVADVHAAQGAFIREGSGLPDRESACVMNGPNAWVRPI